MIVSGGAQADPCPDAGSEWSHEWSVTWTEFTTQVEAYADLDEAAKTALKDLWDDIAMSQTSASSWVDVFERDDFGPVDLPLGEYLNERVRRWNGSRYDDSDWLYPEFDAILWHQAEYSPAVITVADLQRVVLIAELYDLFGAHADAIDTAWSWWFVDNDETDNNFENEDLDAYIRNNNLPIAVADQLRAAMKLNLVDDTFSYGEWKDLLEIIATTASIAGLTVVSGGLGSFLVVAGAVGEGIVISLEINDGNYGAAALNGVFLVFDAADILKRFNVVLKVFRKALQEATIGALGSVASIRRLGVTSGSSEGFARQVDNLADELVAADHLDDAAASIRSRGPDVSSNASSNTAYIEARTREDLIQVTQSPGPYDDALDPELAEQIVEQQFRSGRADLDEVKFTATVSYFDEHGEAGLVAFEKRGDEIIGNDEFANAIGATCVRRSFGPDTLVVRADGSRVAISTLTVDDLVATWNLDSGTASTSSISALWPHTDVLYDVSLSDGSTLSVTEDHLFYNVSTSEWTEIGLFDSADLLRTSEGVEVTVVGVDWSSASEGDAWDMTVPGEHNYFVAGSHDAVPVLAHNASQLCDHAGVLDADAYVALSDLPVAQQDSIAELLAALRATPDGEVAGAATAKVFGDWAAQNAEVAAEIAARKSGWASVAASNSPERFQLMLDAVADAPSLGRLSNDAVETLVNAADFDSIVVRLSSLAKQAVDPVSLGELLRFAPIRVGPLLSVIDNAASVGSTAVRMTENALVNRTITVRLLRDDATIAAQVVDPPVSLVSLVLRGENYAATVKNADAFAKTRRNIDELRDSILAGPPRGVLDDVTATGAERDALERLEQLQQDLIDVGIDAHGLSRHGASTSLWQQFRRAVSGQWPNGAVENPRTGALLNPSPATRALSHVDYLEALEAAQPLADNVAGRFQVFVSFADDRIVGAGFNTFGGLFREPRSFQFFFEDGNWISGFPQTLPSSLRSDQVAITLLP